MCTTSKNYKVWKAIGLKAQPFDNEAVDREIKKRIIKTAVKILVKQNGSWN